MKHQESNYNQSATAVGRPNGVYLKVFVWGQKIKF